MKGSERSQLLKLIYSRGQISQADLVEETNLSPSYISAIVKNLKKNGLLIEDGFSESRGGRRRMLLQINPELAHLIGVDVGTANCRIVVTDFLGRVLIFRRFLSETSKGKSHVLDLVHREIKRCLEEDHKVKGIGMSQSGVIDRKSGTVLFWPKVPGWNNVPLMQIIESTYGLPTIVEDSARTMAIAEQHLGEGRGLRDFVHVCVGMGIGAAIFTNGQLYSGRDGLAGELGHITIDESGDLCSCGNRGCLEVYASGSAIIRKVLLGLRQGVTSSLLDLVGNDFDQLTLETVVAAAESGDRLSYTVLSEAGVHLGTALADIVNLLNPEKIILGAAVPKVAKGFLMDPLIRTLRERAFQQSVSNLEVVVSKLGDEAAAVGAAIMVARKLLEGISYGQAAA